MGGRPFSDEEQRRLCLRLCLDIGHSEPRQFSLSRALNSARRQPECGSQRDVSLQHWETRRDLRCLDRYTRFAALRHWVAQDASDPAALDSHQAEGSKHLHVGLALDPSFTIRRFRLGASSDNPTFLAKRESIYEGLRLAGVPEGRLSHSPAGK
jgi:hypothetical protein